MLFVLTGFSGLLAEQCFEKLLAGLLGASTPAAAVVLAVYFLGLTLGALLYARPTPRRLEPLQIYAGMEAVVALWALLLLAGGNLLIEALAPVLRIGAGHFVVLQGLRVLLACVWILPPTLAMGATFPAIADALGALRVPRPTRALSGFYTLNLIGAIGGAVLGPYFVFPASGLTGALALAFAIDAAVALFALGLWRFGPRRRARHSGPAVAGQAPPVPADAPPAGHPRRVLLLLSIAFASGFLFFALEVVWTHLIAAVLGNSVYAFAAMLALVLIGLGIGGALATLLFPDRRPASTLMVAALLLAGSVALAWQHARWPAVPGLFVLWGGHLTSFEDGELLRWIQAGRLLLPPAILFGMVYPALFRVDLFSVRPRPGRLVALMSAANSVGCVLGALLTGFLLIPALGSEGTLLTLGYLGLCISLAVALGLSKSRLRWLLAGAVLLQGVRWGNVGDWDRLALTSGGHVYFSAGHVQPDSQLKFFHEDTLGGITTVVETPSHGKAGEPPVRSLLTNGKFQANDAAEVGAQTGFALVPFVHTRAFDRALVIGLGSGNSAATVRGLGFPELDIAEISPGMVQAARDWFPHINGRVLEQEGVHLFLEDGRNYLLLTDRRYDLITMEITSVWFAGATSLYSVEFYALARRHLKPGGVFQQWVQVHHLGTSEVGTVLKSVRRVFPFVEFWIVGGQGIVIASEEPLLLRAAALERVLAWNPWGDPDRSTTARHLAKVLGSRLLAPPDLDRLLAGVHLPINTDANRSLEYATPRFNLSREPFEQILLRRFGQFATYPPLQLAGAVPAELVAPLQALEAARRVAPPPARQ